MVLASRAFSTASSRSKQSLGNKSHLQNNQKHASAFAPGVLLFFSLPIDFYLTSDFYSFPLHFHRAIQPFINFLERAILKHSICLERNLQRQTNAF